MKEEVLRIYDTNLILALYNEEDHLHHRAKEHLKGKVLIIPSVSKDARDAFLRKYNQACLGVFKIADKISRSNIAGRENTEEFAEKELEKLISANKNLENMYRYVFRLSKDMLIDLRKHIRLPQFLSDHGIAFVNSLLRPEEEKVLIELNKEEIELREKIYEELLDLKLHLRDKEILCDIVALSTKYKVEFFTADKNFSKKIGRACNILKEKGFSLKLSVFYIESQ